MDSHQIPISIIYPVFEIYDKMWRPIFQAGLPSNFKELVLGFYGTGGKEKLEKYREKLENICREQELGVLEIRLKWHEKEGLTNINLGTHAGFDLDTQRIPHFVEHNIGFNSSIIGGMIIMKYVSELLKSNE